MNWSDFLGASVIAFYAMIGGAFINAAITAPERCLRVMDQMWPQVTQRFLPVGIGFIAVGSFAWLAGEKETSAGITWAGLAHIALFLLFVRVRRIARAAQCPPQQKQN